MRIQRDHSMPCVSLVMYCGVIPVGSSGGL